MPKQKKKRKTMPPSAYQTMPYYFPTEQVDIVKRIRAKRLARRK